MRYSLDGASVAALLVATGSLQTNLQLAAAKTVNHEKIVSQRITIAPFEVYVRLLIVQSILYMDSCTWYFNSLFMVYGSTCLLLAIIFSKFPWRRSSSSDSVKNNSDKADAPTTHSSPSAEKKRKHKKKKKHGE